MSIPSIDDLLEAEVSTTDYSTPMTKGWHNAIIVKAEVRPGNKAPYINVEAVSHEEDDKGRHVWGICSFSEKAQRMPGGPANLLQSTKDFIGKIPKGLDEDEIIAFIAKSVQGVPVRIDVAHEQVERNGEKQFLADGSPEYRARIRQYEPAPDDFVQAIEDEADGVDDDLPF